MASSSDEVGPSLDVGRVQRNLNTRALCRRLVYRPVTTSTMDDARTLAVDQGIPHGTVVVAEQQTHGRGTKDHKWDSSSVGNLYMSVVLRLPTSSTTFQGRHTLEVKACLAVLEAVHDLGITTAVCKWPNDIWVRGHKLAGFLAEDLKVTHTNSNDQESCIVILGIGINVNADVRRSPSLAHLATSLRCELGGKCVDREHLLASICNYLETRLDLLPAVCLEAFRQHSLFQVGMPVVVHDSQTGRNYEAVFSSPVEDWEVVLTAVPEGVGSEHGSVKGSSERFSLRPCCPHSVLVWSRDAGEESATQALYRTLCGLVDTSKFNMGILGPKHLMSEDWQGRAALLAVAAMLDVGAAERKVLESSLRHLIKRGCSILAVGGGAQLLCALLDPPVQAVPVKQMQRTEGDAGNIHVLVDTGDVSFTYFTRGASHTFVAPASSCTVLASYTDQDGSHLGPSVMMIRTAQSGKVCLCDFGMELANTVTQGWGMNREDVFKRDALLLAILEELLSEA